MDLVQHTDAPAPWHWQLQETATRLRPRVIVAEDDPEMRALISEMLQLEGYQVTELADGTQLLNVLIDALAEDPEGLIPELVITDIWMPGHSGLEVLARIRRYGWDTQTIVITAFGDAAAHSEAHRLGAKVVLDKPFDLATLRAVALDLAPIR